MPAQRILGDKTTKLAHLRTPSPPPGNRASETTRNQTSRGPGRSSPAAPRRAGSRTCRWPPPDAVGRVGEDQAGQDGERLLPDDDGVPRPEARSAAVAAPQLPRVALQVVERGAGAPARGRSPGSRAPGRRAGTRRRLAQLLELRVVLLRQRLRRPFGLRHAPRVAPEGVALLDEFRVRRGEALRTVRARRPSSAAGGGASSSSPSLAAARASPSSSATRRSAAAATAGEMSTARGASATPGTVVSRAPSAWSRLSRASRSPTHNVPGGGSAFDAQPAPAARRRVPAPPAAQPSAARAAALANRQQRRPRRARGARAARTYARARARGAGSRPPARARPRPRPPRRRRRARGTRRSTSGRNRTRRHCALALPHETLAAGLCWLARRSRREDNETAGARAVKKRARPRLRRAGHTPRTDAKKRISFSVRLS